PFPASASFTLPSQTFRYAIRAAGGDRLLLAIADEAVSNGGLLPAIVELDKRALHLAHPGLAELEVAGARRAGARGLGFGVRLQNASFTNPDSRVRNAGFVPQLAICVLRREVVRTQAKPGGHPLHHFRGGQRGHLVDLPTLLPLEGKKTLAERLG